MNKVKLLKGLLLLDSAIVILTAGLLPLKSSYSWSGHIELLISSRDRWDIVAFVLVASLLFTAAMVIMFGKDDEPGS